MGRYAPSEDSLLYLARRTAKGGAIISEHTSDINPDAAGNLPVENNQETQGQVADEYREPKPTTPPVSADDDVDSLPNHSGNQTRVPDQQDQAQQPNQADLMTAATQLLVEIAGPAPVHIEMSARGPKKYYDVHRPLDAKDACAYLQGWKTKGGWIRRPDGMTRALAYDADTEEGWEELKTAARFLTYGDYVTLLEPSPVGRGGHLWVLYSDLVKARDAQRHVCRYAPMLGKVSVWVQAFMSPAGWKHFEQLCQEYGHQFLPSDGAEAPSGMPQTQQVAFDTVSAQASDMTGTTPSSQEAYSPGEATFSRTLASAQRGDGADAGVAQSDHPSQSGGASR